MAEQRYQAVLALITEGRAVVELGYQQVCIGQSYAGSACDVLVTNGTLQYWVGNELVKTVAPQFRHRSRQVGRRRRANHPGAHEP